MKSIIKLLLFVFPALIIISGCSSSENKPAEVAVQSEIPDESLYQLTGEWQTQHGDSVKLKKLQGKIPVMSMIFTRCTFACPRIVADLKKIQKSIPEDKKDEVVFVLVSFDSERDNPEKLSAFAKEMKLDNNWMLLHGDAEEVRELSMLLDVKYKKQPDGSFSHSNVITLLDKNGSIASRVEGLGSDQEALISKLNEL